MRSGLRIGLALLAVVFVGFAGLRAADDKPKYDIEAVMEKAHGKDKGLLKVVVSGKADDAQKKELLELYTELGKNKPPKGDDKSWKQKTDALVAAAKDVVDNKDGSAKTLQRAANCMSCHRVHKGK